MNTNKRSPWISGIAIAMIFLTSGCLEGQYKSSYYPDGTTVYAPSGGTQTFGFDYLNESGIASLSFPLGTASSDAFRTPVHFAKLYPEQYSVSTQQELVAALQAPTGGRPRWVELKNSIAVDQNLTLRGDIFLTTNDNRNVIRLVGNVTLSVLPNQKSATETARLRACTSSKWQDLTVASSLRLGVQLDGDLNINNSGSLLFVESSWSISRARISIDSNSSGLGLFVIEEGAGGIEYEANPERNWFAHDTHSAVTFSPGKAPKNERELVIKMPQPNEDPAYLYTDHCQNLRAGIEYDWNGSTKIRDNCDAGLWRELVSSFATCGGAL